MTGTDLSLIAEEMKKAQEILKKIKEMKSGVIGDKRIAVQTGVSSTMSTVSIVSATVLEESTKEVINWQSGTFSWGLL